MMQPVRTTSITPSPERYRLPKPRFGSAAGTSAGLTGATAAVNKVFQYIQANRTREMILEDLMGFGVLRTAMDYGRGKAYGDDKGNLPAAAERLAREGVSILTDNLLGGVVAYGVGAAVSKAKGKAYSNTFTNFATLDLFKDAVGKTSDADGFLRTLGGIIAPEHPGKGYEHLKHVWDKGAPGEQATNLARALGLEHMDVRLKASGQQAWFRLPELFDDVHWFSGHMKKLMPQGASGATGTAGGTWKKTAMETLEKTSRLKNWKLGLGLSAALAATFGAPFLIAGATRKIFGIENYPGEIGLKKSEKYSDEQWARKNWLQKYCPYVYDSLKKGNPLPLALALFPLPFAVGMISHARRLVLNPFAKKTFQRMFDFCKTAPWTAPQQIASGFALLITARLLSARTDNEFRERMVDSFVGWGLWILGTPILKNWIAKGLDSRRNTMLHKTLQEGNNRYTALRDAGEIDHLLPNLAAKGKNITEEMISKTRASNVWMGAISTVATMALLGIVEPWIGIRWTQWNEQRKRASSGDNAAAPEKKIPETSPMRQQKKNIATSSGGVNNVPSFRMRMPAAGYAYRPSEGPSPWQAVDLMKKPALPAIQENAG